MQYRFTCDYESGLGAWRCGDVAELDDDTAAWLLRDVMGCIVPVTPDAPESPRSVETPPNDRQLKKAPRSR